MTAPKPPAEIDVTSTLARALLREQHPHLAERPLVPAASGWDNALFRLGGDLVVRLPRRRVAAELIEHEQRWLPTLAERLPLPVPVPVEAGVPSPALDYPWPWSVVPWFEGASAVASPPTDQRLAAATLGRFVAALHRPAPPDAPANPYRGIPLSARTDLTRTAIADLGDAIERERLDRRWEELAAVPEWDGPAQWLHGDLHPNNLVVAGGEVRAVIDFGDLCGGDPAVDLIGAWLLLDTEARAVFREAAEVTDDDTWRRGQGWALAIAVSIAAHTADDAPFGRVAHRALDAILAEPA